MAEPRTALQTATLERVLAVVLEIIPGQAGEGLIDIYEPGSYEGQSLRELCQRTLSKKNWSIEEQQIVEDINRQLHGGRLLCRGREIQGTAVEHAVLEETEAGEKYLYVPIRAIKPQEGGLEQAETKKWDPNCPKCQDELRRLLELSQGIHDEVNHGGTIDRLHLPDCCYHESEQRG